MKPKQIHILMACTDYDGSAPIRAFESKDDADAYKVLCDAHKDKKPECPVDIADTEQNHKAWDKHWAALERWRKKSPAGADDADNDYFAVVSVPLYTHPAPDHAALLRQALDALRLPCDRWNKQQTLIVNEAIAAIEGALK